VRLRPLTEAECYARCYGDLRTDQVSVLRRGERAAPLTERGDRDDDDAAAIGEEAA
jgi:hypothetical protein